MSQENFLQPSRDEGESGTPGGGRKPVRPLSRRRDSERAKGAAAGSNPAVPATRKRDYQMHAYIDGVRDKDTEKLTPSMWQMLFDTAKHGDPGYSRNGRSAIGAASGSFFALRRRGLMHGCELTDAGRRLLTVEWRYPDEKSSTEGGT